MVGRTGGKLELNRKVESWFRVQPTTVCHMSSSQEDLYASGKPGT